METKSSIEFLLERFRKNKDTDAIVWKDQMFTYNWLDKRVSHYRSYLIEHEIRQGAVVAIKGDFTPNSISLFFVRSFII
jgi:non-ribosomal peptide synthetase component E (peptide arylation enzyme)